MTVATVRPNAVVTTSGFTTTGAASAVAALTDNLDTSYIRKTTSGTLTAILDFDTSTLTSQQVVTRVRWRLRVSSTSASAKANAALGISVNGVNTNSGSTSVVRGVQTITEIAGPWQTTAPDGGEWNQAALDGLRLLWTDYADGGAATFLYDASIDIDLLNRPTVTVTAPTTGSYTSQPNVTWSFTDQDGAPQSAYRIRVFTSTAYGATGFNPETATTAEWDSGIVYSSDLSTTVRGLLTTGTKRYYVKAARDNGAVLTFSDWNFIQSTTTISAPATPTLTAAGQTSSGYTLLTVTGSTPTGFDGQFFQVQRSSDNVNWTYVYNGTSITPSATEVGTVGDYLPDRAVLNYYRARTVGFLGSALYAGAWSSTQTVTLANDAKWWVTPLNNTALRSGALRIMPGFDKAMDLRATVFTPLGRSLPVVISGPISGDSGTYTIAATGNTEFANLEALLKSQDILAILQPDGSKFAARITGYTWVTSGKSTNAMREVSVTFTEVDGVVTS